MAHSEQTARPEQPAHSSEHPARVCAEVAHASARVNGVELHYAHAGNGPLMLFLHGFPQNWYQYRHLLADFSRDHLAVAPDMRGHNLSSKPQDVHRYSTCTLVEDVRQLVERLGYELFVLVGHDVGGAIAWSFALHHPEMLSALVILDTPHPALFDNALTRQRCSRRMTSACCATRSMSRSSGLERYVPTSRSSR
jgi:pimeloyl-ACP methyl ester carboxylesterase